HLLPAGPNRGISKRWRRGRFASAGRRPCSTNNLWRRVPLRQKAWRMSSQEAFLARVRRALHKDAGSLPSRPPLLLSDTDIAEAAAQLQTRLAAQRPALMAQVQQELDAVGGVVAHVRSASEAVAYITRLAQQKDTHMVVRWQSELLET